jgi:hypothetical protein
MIRAGLLAHIVALLARRHICQGDRKQKKARNDSSLSDLCRSCRVESHCWLIGISSSKRWKTMHSIQSCGRDELPSLLPHHINSIDVVVMQAWSPFIVSWAFTVRMVKRLRHIVHLGLSRSWVPKCRFGSLLRCNKRGADPPTLPF